MAEVASEAVMGVRLEPVGGGRPDLHADRCWASLVPEHPAKCNRAGVTGLSLCEEHHEEITGRQPV